MADNAERDELIAEFNSLQRRADEIKKAFAARDLVFGSHLATVESRLRKYTLVAIFWVGVAALLLVFKKLRTYLVAALPGIIDWYGASEFRRTAAWGLAMGIGVGFFFLRKHFRAAYAAIEIGFAGNVITSALADHDPGQVVAKLLAGIYVLVRGLHNFADAVDEFSGMLAPLKQLLQQQREDVDAMRDIGKRMSDLNQRIKSRANDDEPRPSS